jgi:hypothetical protein
VGRDAVAPGGGPFNPRLGDSKIRFRFAPFSAGRFALSYFIESTFPSADPEALGSRASKALTERK